MLVPILPALSSTKAALCCKEAEEAEKKACRASSPAGLQSLDYCYFPARASLKERANLARREVAHPDKKQCDLNINKVDHKKSRNQEIKKHELSFQGGLLIRH